MTAVETISPPSSGAGILGGVSEWLMTTSHRRIGRLLVALSVFWMLIVVLVGTLLSVERISSTSDLVDPTSTTQLFSFFRVGLIFGVMAPMTLGLALAIVPMQIGSQVLAFARAALFGVYLWIFGMVIVGVAYIGNGGPGGGDPQMVDLFLVGMALVIAGLIVVSASIATTVLTSLGWRYTDAWMSMAGMGDKGEPNGLPVDEWGIRVNEKSQPVGSCVARGGATNDAAAVYAVTKAIEWLQKYSPPEAAGMTFGEAGPVPAQGAIAQQMFWYTAFTAASVAPGTPVMNEDGTPKWRMAPSPHGAYWSEGTKIGYQDAGSWTLMQSTPVDRAQAAWLYAQFVVSKTVDVKKSDVGLTFIRQSTIDAQHFTDRAPKLGGLIEFYRSPARVQWSPTGTNVPDYPKLAQLWWQNIGDAMSGAKTPQEALDSLCAEQEKVLIRLEKSGAQGDLGPVMNEEQDPQVWLDEPGSPVAKLDNEKPQGETIAYDELIKSWQK